MLCSVHPCPAGTGTLRVPALLHAPFALVPHKHLLLPLLPLGFCLPSPQLPCTIQTRLHPPVSFSSSLRIPFFLLTHLFCDSQRQAWCFPAYPPCASLSSPSLSFDAPCPWLPLSLLLPGKQSYLSPVRSLWLPRLAGPRGGRWEGDGCRKAHRFSLTQRGRRSSLCRALTGDVTHPFLLLTVLP